MNDITNHIAAPRMPEKDPAPAEGLEFTIYLLVGLGFSWLCYAGLWSLIQWARGVL